MVTTRKSKREKRGLLKGLDVVKIKTKKGQWIAVQLQLTNTSKTKKLLSISRSIGGMRGFGAGFSICINHYMAYMDIRSDDLEFSKKVAFMSKYLFEKYKELSTQMGREIKL